jgi:hypothetical protein
MHVERALSGHTLAQRELRRVSHAPHVHRDSMKPRLALPPRTAYALRAGLHPVRPVSI